MQDADCEQMYCKMSEGGENASGIVGKVHLFPALNVNEAEGGSITLQLQVNLSE